MISILITSNFQAKLELQELLQKFGLDFWLKNFFTFD